MLEAPARPPKREGNWGGLPPKTNPSFAAVAMLCQWHAWASISCFPHSAICNGPPGVEASHPSRACLQNAAEIPRPWASDIQPIQKTKHGPVLIVDPTWTWIFTSSTVEEIPQTQPHAFRRSSTFISSSPCLNAAVRPLTPMLLRSLQLGPWHVHPDFDLGSIERRRPSTVSISLFLLSPKPPQKSTLKTQTPHGPVS